MSEHLQKRPLIREKKLKATNAYFGKINKLLEVLNDDELKQRIRTFSQNSEDEIIYTLKALNGIKNSVIIIHGPLGCASAQLNLYLTDSGSPWFVTNLDENDSILGADVKLKEAINRAVEEYKPEVIFIVSTPVVAINNDDIQSIIYQLEREIKIPLVPIYSDGFKSKIDAYGYDLALHSLAKFILPTAKKTQKESYLNVISVAQGNRQLSSITKILKDLDIKYNVITRDSSIDNIKKAVNALGTITIDKGEGYFLAENLRDNYDVPYIDVPIPIGIEETNLWISKISKLFNKEGYGAEYISDSLDKISNLIESEALIGKKIYVNHSPLVTFQLSDLVRRLKGEIVGVTVSYIDTLSLKHLEKFNDEIAGGNIHVASGQIFEVINAVKKLQPDIYIGKTEDVIWISKLGIKVIDLDNVKLYGYEGVENILKQIAKAFRGNNLENYLKGNTKLPYQESWLGKSTNWYIKQEVK